MIKKPFSIKKEFPEIIDKYGSREDLVKDIPSWVIITFLSVVNHQLHLEKSDQEILDFLGRNWELELKELLKHYFNFKNSQVFSKWTIAEHLKNEILNYRDFEYQYLDTTPQDEFRIFVSHLLFLDEVLVKQDIYSAASLNENSINHKFQQIIWPVAIQQVEFVRKKNFLLEGLKGNLFLRELKHHFNQEKYVENYLQIKGFDHEWSYISSFLNIIKSSLNRQAKIPLITIDKENPYRLLIESKCLNITEYLNSKEQQERYIGIQAKPLYHLRNDDFLILSWDFFYSQIYTGVLFDFYRFSGIREKFNEFPLFKEFVGKQISEKSLFRAFINMIFNKPSDIVCFPNDKEDDLPDAYVRRGNYIYVFEFKDLLVPAKTLDQPFFTDIKNYIHTRLVEKQNSKGKLRKKGVTQLIRHIKYLEEISFSKDPLPRKLTRNKLYVLPVLVHDNPHFWTPGINTYLNYEFQSKYFNKKFKKVYPITLVSLDYLFQNLARLREIPLHNLFKDYHMRLKSLRKSNLKAPTEEKFFKIYQSIEFSKFKSVEKPIKNKSLKVGKILLEFVKELER